MWYFPLLCVDSWRINARLSGRIRDHVGEFLHNASTHEESLCGTRAVQVDQPQEGLEQ